RRAELATARIDGLSYLRRVDLRLPPLVSHPEGFRSDRCQLLSLSDAAAWNAVRLAADRRTCRGLGYAGHHTGRTRHLPRDAADGGSQLTGRRKNDGTHHTDRRPDRA